jgi:hypothetical protein
MNYAVNMGSGFMIYVHTKFRQIFFGIQKLLGEDTHTDRLAHREQAYVHFLKIRNAAPNRS